MSDDRRTVCMMLSAAVMLTTSTLVVLALSAHATPTRTMAKLFPTADRDYLGHTTDDQDFYRLLLRKPPVCFGI